MSDYESWRLFAASWGSLYFAAIFVIAVGFALWPSRRRAMEDAAQIPFREG